MEQVTLLHGDALEVLRTLPDNSVDAIVTDPPGGISFMGREWDSDKGGRDNWIAAFAEIARECLRVVKPGAHALVWAIPRTSHWTATAWENGGWEVRDRVAHVFGSGFPKSHDVSKAIDKAAGAEREVVGVTTGARNGNGTNNDYGTYQSAQDGNYPITAPATDDAKRWQGWGSALKPAVEDWWLLRKPLTGTIAANVLEWGTGGLNIDATRVQTQDDLSGGTYGGVFSASRNPDGSLCKAIGSGNKGRWPAHLIHDGSDEVVAMFPQTQPSKAAQRGELADIRGNKYNDAAAFIAGSNTVRGHDDNCGSAARFFYVAKASKRDRDEGLEGFEAKTRTVHIVQSAGRQMAGKNETLPSRNHHPTVKPTELMRYLCRLITPAGGVVLDPFCGSGSTGKGAVLEGFNFIGIEKESDYLEIAKARIAFAQKSMGLFGGDADD